MASPKANGGVVAYFAKKGDDARIAICSNGAVLFEDPVYRSKWKKVPGFGPARSNTDLALLIKTLRRSGYEYVSDPPVPYRRMVSNARLHYTAGRYDRSPVFRWSPTDVKITVDRLENIREIWDDAQV